MRLTVVIFGKIPGTASTSLCICGSQCDQQMPSTILLSMACQPDRVQTGEHGPQAAIVIGVGLILDLTIEMIGGESGPGRITRLDDRPECREERTADGLFQLLNIRIRLGTQLIISDIRQ
jgi:hypothetical protein